MQFLEQASIDPQDALVSSQAGRHGPDAGAAARLDRAGRRTRASRHSASALFDDPLEDGDGRNCRCSTPRAAAARRRRAARRFAALTRHRRCAAWSAPGIGCSWRQALFHPAHRRRRRARWEDDAWLRLPRGASAGRRQPGYPRRHRHRAVRPPREQSALGRPRAAAAAAGARARPSCSRRSRRPISNCCPGATSATGRCCACCSGSTCCGPRPANGRSAAEVLGAAAGAESARQPWRSRRADESLSAPRRRRPRRWHWRTSSRPMSWPTWPMARCSRCIGSGSRSARRGYCTRPSAGCRAYRAFCCASVSSARYSARRLHPRR
jgi:hypothetical protein